MSARRPIAPVIRNHISKALDLLDDEDTPLSRLIADSFRKEPLKTMNAIVKWVEIEGTNMRRYPPSMREPIEPLGDNSAGYLQLMNTIEDIEWRTANRDSGDAESNSGEKH